MDNTAVSRGTLRDFVYKYTAHHETDDLVAHQALEDATRLHEFSIDKISLQISNSFNNFQSVRGNQKGLVIEYREYLKIANYKIAKNAFSRPGCKDIEINPTRANMAQPQAWSLKIDKNTQSSDGKYKGFHLWIRIFPGYKYLSEREATGLKLFPTTLWYYNTLGSIKEAAYRRVRIISIKEWMEILSYLNISSATKIAQILNIPLGGYRDDGSNVFYDLGIGSTIWASQRQVERPDNEEAPYIFFCREKTNIDGGLDHRGQGFLVWSFYDN